MIPENQTIVIDDSVDTIKEEESAEKTSEKVSLPKDELFEEFLKTGDQEGDDEEDDDDDQDSEAESENNSELTEQPHGSDESNQNLGSETSTVYSTKTSTCVDEAFSKLKLAKNKSESVKDNIPESLFRIKSKKNRNVPRGQPLLTNDDQEEAYQLINYTPDHQTISSAFRLEVKGKNARTLAPRAWLDDEIINFYMEMINDRAKKTESSLKVWACNTFFFTTYTTQGYNKVRRWTKRQKIDVFSLDYMIIPVHLQVHWTCCVIDMQTREITFYDSMRPGRNSNHGDDYCRSMLEYLKEEHKDKKGSVLPNIEDFKISTSNDNPQQNNGSDCGVFTCCMAENVSKTGKLPFNFSCKEMEDIRKKMIVEIKNQRIFDPVE